MHSSCFSINSPQKFINQSLSLSPKYLSLSVTKAVLVTMAITATQNDGVSFISDKISYDLVETDVEIITSGRRRIPAHSAILVRLFFPISFVTFNFSFDDRTFFGFFVFWCSFLFCLNLTHAGFCIAGTYKHHREAEENPRRIIKESH